MQRLGIDWDVGNQKKSGAEFIDEASGKTIYFLFDGEFSTYQVERAVFDQKLFINAEKHGVETHQQELVKSVDLAADQVIITSNKQRYLGQYFIDASGRSALMGRKQATIQRVKNFGRFALYQYFQLPANSLSKALFSTGNIKVLLADVGWIWVIPLTGQRLSLGLVVKKDRPEGLNNHQLFNHSIQASPYLTELLADAKILGDIQAEADFSYLNQCRYGSRYACCGDAGGFLDPIFSSGFFFAVKTAELVADRLHWGFSNGLEADPELHAQDNQVYDIGFQTIYQLIQRFYQSDLINNLVFEADRHPRIKKEITAILAGDLWQPDNKFQQGLLRGRRRQALSNT
jgi:flavin-dependent dehydrogenase